MYPRKCVSHDGDGVRRGNVLQAQGRHRDLGAESTWHTRARPRGCAKHKIAAGDPKLRNSGVLGSVETYNPQ